MMLMDLPLEALSILQDDSLCSVSRDFSLQLLHSRLHDQPDKGTEYINSYPHPCSLFSSFGKYHNKNFSPSLLCPKIIHSSSAEFSFNGGHETPSLAYPKNTETNSHYHSHRRSIWAVNSNFPGDLNPKPWCECWPALQHRAGLVWCSYPKV